ncbi:MAG: aminopeptidase P family protein [Tissierellia bacterium]|nr:aminopeptidase P family protein [Tissierellia bacterium]
MILNKLRRLMKENKIDYYIIPSLDPHGSEYLPEYYQERFFVTGFSGSAGTAVISQEDAYLWTDGRYYIQAKREIEDYGFTLQKQGLEGVPNYDQWIYDHISTGNTVGLNGKYYIEKNYQNLQKQVEKKQGKIVDIDLIKDLWMDRASLPNDQAYLHDITYTGRTREEKIDTIRKILKERKATMTIISSLEDIAWTLNIRGNDIEYTPVLLSYLIITEKQVRFYASPAKVQKIKKEIKDFVTICNYDEFYDDLSMIEGERIYLDPERVNHKLYSSVSTKNRIIEGQNITLPLKAIKNKTELEHQRDTYVRDGVYLTKFIHWLKKEIKKRKISEVEAAEKLDSYRKQDPLYVSNSFGTISAYGENGAMMHYSATEQSQSDLEAKGFYLVDSGGQYYSGTTDITRTIALGPLTEEEIHDFTVVLKSHLALLHCIFLKGTSDTSLDAITRYHVWQQYSDYKCGTGHGVGYFLSCHEGPQKLDPRTSPVEMKEGMIVSNEPGIYKGGKYGIRLENIMEVVRDKTNEDGTFLSFDVLSLAPIDLDAIDIQLLSDKEIQQLNGYHRLVYDRLEKYLSSEEKDWLEEVTKPLER